MINKPRITLVGRPNVGKSTIFNRLTGTKHALVHDEPGMTRDRRQGDGNLFDLDFFVEDTPGVTEQEDAVFYTQMHEQTLKSIECSDGVLFIVDGEQGCTPIERDFVKDLSKMNKPVWVVVNKCEGNKGLVGVSDASSLPIKGNVIEISALHNEGMYELYESLKSYWPDACSKENENTDKPLKITVLGRPNVGKSTLINALLKEDRLLVADYAGVTRDSIACRWSYDGRDIELTDTAGIRRGSRVYSTMEKLAVMDAKRSLNYSDIALVVIDATQALDKQDMTLMRMVADEGRGMVILINKWDIAQKKDDLRKKIKNHLSEWIPHVRGVPINFISASNGVDANSLFKEVLSVYDNWNRRIGTSHLNKWLECAISQNPPPVTNGRRIRIKFISQVKTRPPTFTLHCTKGDDIAESYKRYLVNQLRDSFDFRGTPIRILIKTIKNPYAGN